MKIRFGIIGAGDFGELHLKVLSKHPEAEIKWICVRTLSHAQEMAQKYGGKPTNSYKDILEDNTVDAISILTPEQVHFEQAMAALEYNKDILIEKPIATNYIHADTIAKKAKDKNKIVLPAHICRFKPNYAKVREYLSKDKKEIISIYARRNVPRNRLKLHNRVHPVLMALSHDIDLIISYVKSIPVRIFAIDRKTNSCLENPDIFWGMIEFSNGCIAVLESLWVLPTDARYVDATMEIATVSEVIHINYPNNGVWIDSPEGFKFPGIGTIDYINEEWVGALSNEINYFIKCVKYHKKPTIVTLEEAVLGIKVAQTLIQSALEKREIFFNLDII